MEKHRYIFGLISKTNIEWTYFMLSNTAPFIMHIDIVFSDVTGGTGGKRNITAIEL